MTTDRAYDGRWDRCSAHSLCRTTLLSTPRIPFNEILDLRAFAKRDTDLIFMDAN